MKGKLFFIVLFGCGLFTSCNNEDLSKVTEEQMMYQGPTIHSSNEANRPPWINGPDGHWQYNNGRWVWVEEVPGWDGGGPSDGTDEGDHDSGVDDSGGGKGNSSPSPDPHPELPLDLVIRDDEGTWSQVLDFPNEEVLPFFKVYIAYNHRVVFRCQFLKGNMDYIYSRDKLEPLDISGSGSFEFVDWDGDEDFYEFTYDFWDTGTYYVQFRIPGPYYNGAGRIRLTMEGREF